MMSRIQNKAMGWQDEQLSSQPNQVDSIAEVTRRCMREELAPVVVRSVEGCLQAQVEASYEGMMEEYQNRQRQNDK